MACFGRDDDYDDDDYNNGIECIKTNPLFLGMDMYPMCAFLNTGCTFLYQ